MNILHKARAQWNAGCDHLNKNVVRGDNGLYGKVTGFCLGCLMTPFVIIPLIYNALAHRTFSLYFEGPSAEMAERTTRVVERHFSQPQTPPDSEVGGGTQQEAMLTKEIPIEQETTGTVEEVAKERKVEPAVIAAAEPEPIVQETIGVVEEEPATVLELYQPLNEKLEKLPEPHRTWLVMKLQQEINLAQTLRIIYKLPGIEPYEECMRYISTLSASKIPLTESTTHQILFNLQDQKTEIPSPVEEAVDFLCDLNEKVPFKDSTFAAQLVEYIFGNYGNYRDVRKRLDAWKGILRIAGTSVLELKKTHPYDVTGAFTLLSDGKITELEFKKVVSSATPDGLRYHLLSTSYGDASKIKAWGDWQGVWLYLPEAESSLEFLFGAKRVTKIDAPSKMFNSKYLDQSRPLAKWMTRELEANRLSKKQATALLDRVTVLFLEGNKNVIELLLALPEDKLSIWNEFLKGKTDPHKITIDQLVKFLKDKGERSLLLKLAPWEDPQVMAALVETVTTKCPGSAQRYLDWLNKLLRPGEMDIAEWNQNTIGEKLKDCGKSTGTLLKKMEAFASTYPELFPIIIEFAELFSSIEPTEALLDYAIENIRGKTGSLYGYSEETRKLQNCIALCKKYPSLRPEFISMLNDKNKYENPLKHAEEISEKIDEAEFLHLIKNYYDNSKVLGRVASVAKSEKTKLKSVLAIEMKGGPLLLCHLPDTFDNIPPLFIEQLKTPSNRHRFVTAMAHEDASSAAPNRESVLSSIWSEVRQNEIGIEEYFQELPSVSSFRGTSKDGLPPLSRGRIHKKIRSGEISQPQKRQILNQASRAGETALMTKLLERITPESANVPYVKKMLNLVGGDNNDALATILSLDSETHAPILKIIGADNQKTDSLSSYSRGLLLLCSRKRSTFALALASETPTSPERQAELRSLVTQGHLELAELLWKNQDKQPWWPKILTLKDPLVQRQLASFALDPVITEARMKLILDFAEREDLSPGEKATALSKLQLARTRATQPEKAFDEPWRQGGLEKEVEDRFRAQLNLHDKQTSLSVSRAIAFTLLTQSGDINVGAIKALEDSKTFKELTIKPSVRAHLKRTLDTLKNHSSFGMRLSEATVPLEGSQSDQLIRRMLKIREGAEITPLHVQEVILSSLLWPTRQSAIGSCYATNLIIQMQTSTEGLFQLLEDYLSLTSSSCLKRRKPRGDNTTVTYPLFASELAEHATFQGDHLLSRAHEYTVASTGQRGSALSIYNAEFYLGKAFPLHNQLKKVLKENTLVDLDNELMEALQTEFFRQYKVIFLPFESDPTNKENLGANVLTNRKTGKQISSLNEYKKAVQDLVKDSFQITLTKLQTPERERLETALLEMGTFIDSDTFTESLQLLSNENPLTSIARTRNFDLTHDKPWILYGAGGNPEEVQSVYTQEITSGERQSFTPQSPEHCLILLMEHVKDLPTPLKESCRRNPQLLIPISFPHHALSIRPASILEKLKKGTDSDQIVTQLKKEAQKLYALPFTTDNCKVLYSDLKPVYKKAVDQILAAAEWKEGSFSEFMKTVSDGLGKQGFPIELRQPTLDIITGRFFEKCVKDDRAIQPFYFGDTNWKGQTSLGLFPDPVTGRLAYITGNAEDGKIAPKFRSIGTSSHKDWSFPKYPKPQSAFRIISHHTGAAT